MGRLDNRVIIVTGGALGIGKAYCEGLAAEGANVVVADINTTASDELVRSLGEQGHDAIALNVDVSNVEQADNMAKATIERFGRIDALINNAAVFQRPAMTRGPFDQVSVEEWGPSDGGEPARHIPVRPRCRPLHEAAGRWQHHQHQLPAPSTLGRPG